MFVIVIEIVRTLIIETTRVV